MILFIAGMVVGGFLSLLLYDMCLVGSEERDRRRRRGP